MLKLIRTAGVVTVALLSCASARADGSRSVGIGASCGAANLTLPSDSAGAICLTVCGDPSTWASCTRSGHKPRISQAVAVPATADVQLQVVGRDLTVADIAESLQRATGWRVDVPKGDATARVQRCAWSGQLHELSGARLKVRGGQAVEIHVSTERQAVQLVVVRDHAGLW
ncbi:MAG: hypothetical protein HY049_04630 [Acidobacteria bacterium]|nr:hypothetical protein [Acidobacteriota bacterium]